MLIFNFMHLQEAINDYQNKYADEQNLTEKSRKNRRLFMGRVTTYFIDKSFDLSTCRGFLDEMRKTNTPASMITIVKYLRAFIHFIYDKYEYIEKDFSSKIPMPKTNSRDFQPELQNPKRKRPIILGTVAGISDNRYAKKSKIEARIGLLFMLYTGLRNSELRKLQVEDFNINEKIFKVHSKGGKVELANIPVNMIKPLRDWIYVKKSGKMFEITEDSMRTTLLRGCKKLGLPPQRIHNLRHIFSLTRLRRREPLQLVSRALRHKKISTTDKFYSEFLITDLAPTVNNSAEIQKDVNTETVLDTVDQVLKNIGITHDPRFKYHRKNGKIIIEVVA